MKTLSARKQIFIVLIVLTLAQFACNLGAQASSAATQPAPSGSGNCDVNPYLPVKAGATYTFAGTTSAGAYTRTSTFTNVHADGFQAEVVTAVGNKSTTTTESWQCTADGLVQPGG
ncbi:MAG: hypothetical protein WAN58_18755, partial [Anaerolineales bacterium]